jgi:hypothetical protein
MAKLINFPKYANKAEVNIHVWTALARRELLALTGENHLPALSCGPLRIEAAESDLRSFLASTSPTSKEHHLAHLILNGLRYIRNRKRPSQSISHAMKVQAAKSDLNSLRSSRDLERGINQLRYAQRGGEMRAAQARSAHLPVKREADALRQANPRISNRAISRRLSGKYPYSGESIRKIIAKRMEGP